MGDWRVKYDGVCSRCGVALRAGEVAVYDGPTRTIHCVSCPTSADREPEAIDAGVAGRSARLEHDRRAAKREAVVKERWGNRIGGVVLALALALPDAVMARPTGFERADAINIRIPIERCSDALRVDGIA